MAETKRDGELVDVRWHEHAVSRADREAAAGHKGCVLWFTGLSGCGKSTLANAVDRGLHARGCRTFVLDGDNVRHGLCGDLGFTPKDRTENIRRVGEVAHILSDAGLVVITTFISPYREDRERVRKIVEGDFVEVYVKCHIEECEKRDPKGLYKKAKAGEIKDFTGLTAPYEEPVKPELTLDTSKHSVPESVTAIMDYLKEIIYVEKHTENIKSH